MDISFDYYRTFYYVAKYRSFTKAADALMRNQPNVTRTIKLLEQALGCSLFERSNRTVRLTPEGERLFPHVKAACEHLQLAEAELNPENPLESGVVSIGTSVFALHLTLLPIIQTFKQTYPGIRLRIYNSSTVQAISALKNRLVDFSLVTTPAPVVNPLTSLVLDSFREIPVCGTAFSELARAPLSLQTLCQYPLITLAGGTKTRAFHAKWFHDHGLTLEPDMEAATADQLLPLIKNNLGIGFLPEAMIREDLAAGNVLQLALDCPVPERHICLIKHMDLPLSMAARKLEEQLLCRG